MKTVVKLLPIGNVTITDRDQLRHTHTHPHTHTPTHTQTHAHTHRQPGNTHTCIHAYRCISCTYRDVYAPVSVEHAYSGWYVRLTNLCTLTHLHMSSAVVARAVMRGDRSYATSLGSPEGAESQRDRGEGREMPFIQPSASNDTTFPSVFFTFPCSAAVR